MICMNTFGNTTRIAGQITRFWRNGVQARIPPTGTHNIWVVVDKGEGQATPDLVSLMRFSNAATAQIYCATGFLSVVFANQEGDVHRYSPQHASGLTGGLAAALFAAAQPLSR